MMLALYCHACGVTTTRMTLSTPPNSWPGGLFVRYGIQQEDRRPEGFLIQILEISCTSVEEDP